MLGRLTMYRLMLYYLVALVTIVAVVSFSVNVIFEALFLLVVCYVVNKIFAKIFSVPTNFESFAITALILTLIVGPTSNFYLLSFVAVIAMTSKYLLAINRRHLFNPAAVAVVFSAIFLHQAASWWVGTDIMTIPILLGGLLILKKIRRFTLALVFLSVYSLLNFQLPSAVILFFTFVMLPEPLTSPVILRHQILYTIFIALAFKLLPASFPLELSLVLGNLLTYFLAPTGRFVLKLVRREKLSETAQAFYFQPNRPLRFIAGQYLELTLPHQNPDSRGTRRFFTIASSPSEPEIMIASKFVENGSSFKKALLALPVGGQLFANGPAGEFTLPKNPNQKIAFIAGGIGITPFRSIQKPDIILLYTAASDKEFVFKDILPKAIRKVGRLEETDIPKNISDYKERLFYISGPEPMVEATSKMVRSLGVPPWRIKHDFFPGYEA